MGRREGIRIPDSLKPLLEKPTGWPHAAAWRVATAACRASGVIAWAAWIEAPGADKPTWLDGRTPSRPGIVQSECVDALIAALRTTPDSAAVEVIAPTSLRYLVEGARFPEGEPESCLAELARQRRIWARYAFGEQEAPVAECLLRAYASLAPLRWPGEAALDSTRYVLYADGGCTPDACAAAWVLRRAGETLAERAWCLPGPVERDGVRLAEFLAAADGLQASPSGAQVSLVTDHADVTDFGVRGTPAFRPSRSVAPVLKDLLERAGEREVAWYWAARDETEGQRRCQRLIDRQLRAATAWRRFAEACIGAGVERVVAPDFDQWLAPREPITGLPDQLWSATFERRERYLAADPTSPRTYVRQVKLGRAAGDTLREAFNNSRARGWCDSLIEERPIAGSAATFLGHLRSQFSLVALLFEPDIAVLLQTRPGAWLPDITDAANSVREVWLRQ